EEAFFHWELEFPVAFYDEDGGRVDDDGFDAVIGNPPYGMIEDGSLGKYCDSVYDVAEARHEIYKFFSEKGYRLTAPAGFFGYIISNTLFTNQFDQKIRELLLTNTSWKSIVTFQGDVFEDPTIHPAIFVVEKIPPSQDHELELFTNATVGTDIQEWEKRHIRQSRYINSENYLITVIPDKGEAEVWHKLSSRGRRLGDVAYIRQCIKTGDNDEYLANFEEEPGEPWRPVLTGRDIGRYNIDWPNRYVKYGDWLARNWKNEDFYERSKITIRETSDRITAALDEENRYLLSTLYSVYYRDNFDGEDSLKYLLGVINSDAAQFYMYQLVFALNEGAFTKARTNHYERLPIPFETADETISQRKLSSNQDLL
ncbi:MAG: TaqI-like C-terminal specificity domain-containing protein, partial [Halobacteriaceae archaeon]